MGFTSNRANALGNFVTDGTKIEIYEFGGQRSLSGDGAVPGVWSGRKWEMESNILRRELAFKVHRGVENAHDFQEVFADAEKEDVTTFGQTRGKMPQP